MNAALILTIIALALFCTSIVITACSIAVHVWKKHENSVKEALRALDQRPAELWEVDT